MNAILLTVFVGVVLVSFFVLLFLRYRRDATSSSPERDSLLPFEEETARIVERRISAVRAAAVARERRAMEFDS